MTHNNNNNTAEINGFLILIFGFEFYYTPAQRLPRPRNSNAMAGACEPKLAVGANRPNSAVNVDGSPLSQQPRNREVQDTLFAAVERLGVVTADLTLMRERNAALEAELVEARRREARLQARLQEELGATPAKTRRGVTQQALQPGSNRMKLRRGEDLHSWNAKQEDREREVEQQLEQALEAITSETAARAHAEGEAAHLRARLGETASALDVERELRLHVELAVEQLRQTETELRIELEQRGIMLEVRELPHKHRLAQCCDTRSQSN